MHIRDLRHLERTALLGALVWLALTPVVGRAATSNAGAACALTVSKRLQGCLAHVARRTLRCHEESLAACPDGDEAIADALGVLEAKVRRICSTPEAITDAGFAALSQDGLVTRLRHACSGEVGSLAARAFGGPHAEVFRSRAGPVRACLAAAFDRGAVFLRNSFKTQSRCVRRHQSGRTCDVGSVERKLTRITDAAARRIARRCGPLENYILLDIPEFLARTASQARCLVPTAHGRGDPLDLDCGPRASVPVPPRATATQVVLDGSVWGTRCGDGSPYAFWVRLAPNGAPPENVVVHMQGGGICLFNSDCRNVSAGLFKALDNNLATGGYMSNTNPDNPFRDWTKVYLPYCTQDVHFGGGESSVFPDITVHRYGAKNVRAALRYVRDLLWQELDASPEGYRPDRPRVIFGGTSAGGFGASFNYHYILDDLRWTRTTAVPGAALGIDNGELLGMRGLGILFRGWGSVPMYPPYCADHACSVVPLLQALHSARLGAIPEQQILNVSNQVDNTQVGTTYFDSLPEWIDGLRGAYCANQGLPGVRYFLPAVPSHIHGILGSNSRFPSGLVSDGVTVGEWLGEAIADPLGVVDRVEEGDLATLYGAAPFSCPVAGGGSP